MVSAMGVDARRWRLAAHREGVSYLRLVTLITVALQQQSFACCTNALQTCSRVRSLICEDKSAPPGDEKLRLRDGAKVADASCAGVYQLQEESS